METTLLVGCLIPSLSVIYTDLKYHKIYNWITVPLFLAGIGYALYTNTITNALTGALFAFAVFMLCGLMLGIGGGDIKLATALGAWFGFPQILYVILIGSIMGVVWGACKLYRLGRLKARIKALLQGIWLRVWYRVKGTIVLPQLPQDGTIHPEAIPFGVPLVIAAWFVAVL